MKIKTYLYDSKGHNKEVEFGEEICRNLNNNQLLWVDVLEREKETIEYVTSVLKFKNISIGDLANEFERPKLDKFEHFYRFFINSIHLDVPISDRLLNPIQPDISRTSINILKDWLMRSKAHAIRF